MAWKKPHERAERGSERSTAGIANAVVVDAGDCGDGAVAARKSGGTAVTPYSTSPRTLARDSWNAASAAAAS